MEAVLCLYNQVEEGVHTLVMRSNQSLQHLDHVLLLRETEEKLNTVRQQHCRAKFSHVTYDIGCVHFLGYLQYLRHDYNVTPK